MDIVSVARVMDAGQNYGIVDGLLGGGLGFVRRILPKKVWKGMYHTKTFYIDPLIFAPKLAVLHRKKRNPSPCYHELSPINEYVLWIRFGAVG